MANEKTERLLESAAALLSAADGKQLNTTNLNKAVFYLDLYALRDFGSPVSHSAFVALKEGPVVAKYEKRLIKPLTESGIAVQEQHGMALPVRLVRELGTWRYLSAAELSLARDIGKRFSRMTAAQASRISHQNPGWLIAYNDGLGAKKRPLPIDLSIAMQQIVADDPWLNSELTDTEKAAVAAADGCEGELW
ncbi:MAG: Panacea domain-containing protein [Planctomycetota bacterium]|nr:Panacea domain-containing protein [Planctomycetota bacterium]